MRGTPSCSTTSACFPMERSARQKARAEPTASPSGRACEVSTKRSCWAMCRRTSSRWSLCLVCTGILALLVSFPCPLQQLFNSRLVLLSAIESENQFRGAANAQPLYQLVADIFTSGFKAFDATVSLGIVTLDIDPDFRGASVVSNMDRSHTHQAYPRIRQLALYQRFDFLA